MNWVLFFFSIGFLLGCTHERCHNLKRSGNLGEVVIPAVNANSDGIPPKANARHVKVYKYDGSLQCGKGKLIPLEKMQLDLEQRKIKVFSSANLPDGLVHIQVCGSITGMANVYEISEENFIEAEKAGFKKWISE
ncbi:MAG: hypothetical protein K1X29_05905 [Bdellovibrionales bacterium]|nr:hypothetical protein [Bdellovibrionales bacterium]